MVFFPKHNPSLIMRKTSDKPKWKVILQNAWPVFFKTVKVKKNKAILRKLNGKKQFLIDQVITLGYGTLKDYGMWKLLEK